MNNLNHHYHNKEVEDVCKILKNYQKEFQIEPKSDISQTVKHFLIMHLDNREWNSVALDVLGEKEVKRIVQNPNTVKYRKSKGQGTWCGTKLDTNAKALLAARKVEFSPSFWKSLFSLVWLSSTVDPNIQDKNFKRPLLSYANFSVDLRDSVPQWYNNRNAFAGFLLLHLKDKNLKFVVRHWDSEESSDVLEDLYQFLSEWTPKEEHLKSSHAGNLSYIINNISVASELQSCFYNTEVDIRIERIKSNMSRAAPLDGAGIAPSQVERVEHSAVVRGHPNEKVEEFRKFVGISPITPKKRVEALFVIANVQADESVYQMFTDDNKEMINKMKKYATEKPVPTETWWEVVNSLVPEQKQWNTRTPAKQGNQSQTPQQLSEEQKYHRMSQEFSNHIVKYFPKGTVSSRNTGEKNYKRMLTAYTNGWQEKWINSEENLSEATELGILGYKERSPTLSVGHLSTLFENVV